MGWLSYAIVSNTDPGAGRVICFANEHAQPVFDVSALFESGNVRLREIPINLLRAVMKSTSFTIVKQENKMLTLQRALVLLRDNPKFNLSRFNSEHFATGALMEERVSNQITNLQGHIKKHLISGGLAAAGTKEGCQLLNLVQKQLMLGMSKAREETVKVGVKQAAREGIKQAVGETAESVVTEGAKQLVMEGSKSVAKETVEETVSTAAKIVNGVKNGAKSGVVFGVFVEGVFLSYRLQQSYNQFSREEISERQFRCQVMSDVGSSGGSVAGGAVGAAVGTAVFPVVGTIIGGAVGGILGSFVGSKVGEATDHVVFEP